LRRKKAVGGNIRDFGAFEKGINNRKKTNSEKTTSFSGAHTSEGSEATN